eukprot:12446344-Alexandrium_andersonii.AAC.1
MPPSSASSRTAAALVCWQFAHSASSRSHMQKALAALPLPPHHYVDSGIMWGALAPSGSRQYIRAAAALGSWL